MAYIKKLKDIDNNTVYPQTHTNAIYDEDGEVLQNWMDKYLTTEELGEIDSITGEAEVQTNKVTEISETSTNTEYPSAKAVYNALPKGMEMQNNKTKTININSTDEQYPSAKATYNFIDTAAEKKENKIATITVHSTDNQYPSAKAVYDFVLANKNVGVKMEVVEELPTSNIDSNTIYLKQSETGSYQMFVYADGLWREIGSTDIDLSNYATKAEIPTNVSQLANDKNYATINQIPDVSNFAEKSAIPTKVSQLTNDSDYATVSQIPDVSNFATVNQIPDVSNFATKDDLGTSSIPTGLICMWSGATVPTGWNLCDGTNGTPDLRDRFIVGSGSSYAIGATGGEVTHTLTTAEMPSHTHSSRIVTASGSTNLNGSCLRSPGAVLNVESTSSYQGNLMSTTSVGSGSAHENRPPYYALAFIMKI